MWNHCIVCSSDLGENRDLEEFQIGSRLAFDSEKGRLWVVCPKCERWNLVPMDQRWEAVEALERAFRGTPSRFSTAEIGLARLGGGLEIVRIGQPVPGEFAAWRWGSRFGRRKRRLKSSEKKREKQFVLERGPALAAGIALAPLAPILAPLVVAGGIVMAPALLLSRLEQNWPVEPGSRHRVNRWQLKAGGIAPSEEAPGWSIHVQTWEAEEAHGSSADRFGWVEYTGDRAISLARRVLPLLNKRAPRLVTVSDAVSEIASQGGVEGYLGHAAALKPRWVAFRHYPRPILLAMEMALFESEERRALEGELERLTAAWREAEEIAAISDNLILPSGWDAFRAQAKAAKEGGPRTTPPPKGRP
jgi:hypothetical protein